MRVRKEEFNLTLKKGHAQIESTDTKEGYVVVVVVAVVTVVVCCVKVLSGWVVSVKKIRGD